jgi:hypothetical protein
LRSGKRWGTRLAAGAVARSVSLAVGCISIMLGLYWGYPLVGRLF